MEEDHRVGQAPPQIPCWHCKLPAGRDYGAENKVFNAEAARADSQYPYVSSRLPRNLKGCECAADGKPIIQSKAHEDRVARSHGMRRE